MHVRKSCIVRPSLIRIRYDRSKYCSFVCAVTKDTLIALTQLRMQVGPRQVWKAADHPFRRDKHIQLTGIPSLVKYTDTGLGVRLSSQLETAKTPAEAEAIAKQFISDAAQNRSSNSKHTL